MGGNINDKSARRKHVGIDDAMDIEGLIGNAYVTARTTKHVEERASYIKNHDVANTKDRDVDFVQVWEEIQVAVNMVNEVGRKTEFVPEDGREPTEVVVHEGAGVGCVRAIQVVISMIVEQRRRHSMRSILHKLSMHKLAAIMNPSTMHGSTNEFVVG